MMTAQVFLEVLTWMNCEISMGPNKSTIEKCHTGEDFSLKRGRGAINCCMASAFILLQAKHWFFNDFTILEA